MTISCDPTDDICWVRLTIGDATEEYIIADSVIQYLLDTEANKQAAALKSLEWCIAALSKDAFDQATDEVSAKLSQQLDAFRQRYKDLTTNPNMVAVVGLPCFGGTSKVEVQRVRTAPDSNLPPVQSGSWDTSSCASTENPNNPFFLDGDCY